MNHGVSMDFSASSDLEKSTHEGVDIAFHAAHNINQMVNNQTLDHTFAALADPTRRAMLARLARGDVTVGQLAEPFDMSLPAVSKHLRVLERAGLLEQDRQGRIRRCRLRGKSLKPAADWIDRYRRFWTAQLDALAEFLESNEPISPQGGGPNAPKRNPAKRKDQP